MDCPCHGEPMYWNRKNIPAGGTWQCAVTQRERVNARYASDPLFRIKKNLQNDAQKRARTIQRMKERLSGEVSSEGPC